MGANAYVYHEHPARDDRARMAPRLMGKMPMLRETPHGVTTDERYGLQVLHGRLPACMASWRLLYPTRLSLAMLCAQRQSGR